MGGPGRRPRGGATLLPLTWARMRADAVVLATIAALVVVASGVLAALPRAIDQLADASLAAELDAAPIARRSIRVQALVPVPTGGSADPLAEVRARGPAELTGAGPALTEALEDPNLVLDTPRYRLDPLPGEQPPDGNIQLLTLRVHDDAVVGDHVEVVEGRLPDGEVGTVTTATGDVLDVHQVAVTARTAELLDLRLGEPVLATPDAEDALARRTPTFALPPIAIEVVGLLALSDPDHDVWFDDERLHRPSRYDTGGPTTFTGFGLVTAAGLDGVPRSGSQDLATATWRFGVRDGALDASSASAIAAEVRRLEASTTTVASLEGATVHTDLGATLEREQVRRTAATDTLALAGVALAVVALTLIAVAARLTVARRRRATALARSRGASTGQLLRGQVLEAVLVLLPAGALGWWAAALLVPHPRSLLSSLAVVAAFVAAAGGLVVITAVLELRRALVEVFHGTDLARGGGAASRAGEVLIGLGAVLGVVLLQRRGLTVGAGTDALVIAVPSLVVLGAGLLVARAYRPVVERAGARLRRRVGVVAGVGPARSARDRRLTPGVLVVALTVGVAFLSAGLATTIEDGQDEVAWRHVGAAMRVEAPTGVALSPEVRETVTRVVGRERHAALHATRTTVRTEAGTGQADVVVADVAALTAASADTPVAFRPPPELPTVGGDRGVHTPDDGEVVVPALVATAGPEGARTRVGDRFEVRLGHVRVVAEAIATRERVDAAGLDDGPWVLLPHHLLPDAPEPNQLIVAGATEQLEAIEAAVGDEVRTVRRDEVVTQLRDQPLAAGVVTGYRWVAWLALAGALVGSLAVLVLTDRTRSRDLALLRALGVDRRRGGGVVAVELLPPVLAAVGAGIATGLWLAWLLEAALDLAPFTGAAVAGPPSPTATLPLAAGVLIAAVLLVGSAAWWPRSLRPARTLREGDTT